MDLHIKIETEIFLSIKGIVDSIVKINIINKNNIYTLNEIKKSNNMIQ